VKLHERYKKEEGSYSGPQLTKFDEESSHFKNVFSNKNIREHPISSENSQAFMERNLLRKGIYKVHVN